MWQRSLRPLDPGVEEGGKKKKPAWNVSCKKNSPSDVTNREGGSLWTARKMPPRPPKPRTPSPPPTPKEPTPPPTPPPEPVQIPWRDRYQFEPMGPTLGRTNIIESAIRQIQDENILPIGHYPKDGFVNDHFTEARSASRLSNSTFTMNSNNNFGGISRMSRSSSRSKSPGPSPSPGLFSRGTVSSKQKQKESVDYTFGQYQFSNDLPPPPEPLPRPEPMPDWNRRPSQAFSDDSKMSSFKSVSLYSEPNSNFNHSNTIEKKKIKFKKSSTLLNGPMPIWLDNGDPTRGC